MQEKVYFLYPCYIDTTIYIESLFATNEVLEIMYKPISVEMVVALLFYEMLYRLEKDYSLEKRICSYEKKKKHL